MEGYADHSSTNIWIKVAGLKSISSLVILTHLVDQSDPLSKQYWCEFWCTYTVQSVHSVSEILEFPISYLEPDWGFYVFNSNAWKCCKWKWCYHDINESVWGSVRECCFISFKIKVNFGKIIMYVWCTALAAYYFVSVSSRYKIQHMTRVYDFKFLF